ncbi:hypothetical protein F3J11_26140 [Burkholderia sp. Cy-647]|nr:hypothetical protein [Burkholderia sp. Tr-860]NIF66126.1 hypothetical protein [Burkholderia sp. Cy-647]NIF74184.1 hypothetical protein [Burkholderia sp. Ap-962]NIF96733.1 hypothetical protein [Burkholderia sp. Ax-1720]
MTPTTKRAAPRGWPRRRRRCARPPGSASMPTRCASPANWCSPPSRIGCRLRRLPIRRAGRRPRCSSMPTWRSWPRRPSACWPMTARSRSNGGKRPRRLRRRSVTAGFGR